MKILPKTTTLLAGAALMLVASAPLRAEESADTVMAVVNGDEITLGHVIAARFALPEDYQALPNDVLLPGLIEQLIQQTVLGQAIEEMSARAKIQLDNERRAIVATEKLDEVISGAVDDAKVQAAYDETYADAEPTQEWNASHILVETEEEAQALVDELAGGAEFPVLAREHSTGPSGPSGGELGWFGPGMMVEPFEVAVADMDVGDVAGPVQTEFGWHVLKLNDARMKGAPALDEVRGEIEEQLENDAVEQALATLLDAATIERTDVEAIDPDVLSDVSLLD
ncbi:peptidylprolyl isomerase [Maritimibacter sp. HL-12]|uniref:peptidylprolyl isomerase n=1 Tax=Maritimibacter sp. HL-12 TaxID=1162418 RepID=UPI000A0F097A|nr:peptidylprolyl isomerase [Maritimibacter sp. HL-12]SMH45293.1 peptidyl-prolyl cis-trans isomerase C [Maritimibacter sp. HL-12]